MAKQQEIPMVQLRNVNSGALVSVREEKLPRMGSEWEPADAAAKTAAKKAADDKAAAKKAATATAKKEAAADAAEAPADTGAE